MEKVHLLQDDGGKVKQQVEKEHLILGEQTKIREIDEIKVRLSI
ncbi:hypothetical protein [Paenibacillus sp. MMS20-IR301]|nr:hypothetical protein [Paenibacillus sp. MMS20-IR301]WNS46315.1 hypothetical protein LOS79_13955 [Paenibacillus sp. MMS20-IR301]